MGEMAISLHKLFLMADLDATIQTNHFPELAKRVGKKSAFEYFFNSAPDKNDHETAVDAAIEFSSMVMGKMA